METSSDAPDAVRALFEHVANARITRVDCGQHRISKNGIDMRIGFDHDEIRHALLIGTKFCGSPRFVRSAVYWPDGCIADSHQSRRKDVTRRLTPTVIGSWLFPGSWMHNVAYLTCTAMPALLSVTFILADPSRTTRRLKSAQCDHFHLQGQCNPSGLVC